MTRNPAQLRQIGQFLKEATTCARCEKSIMVKYTSWRGHGTGQHGASHYSPTGAETVTPETHCTCPGGPVWQLLKVRKDVEEELKLTEAFTRWQRDYNQDVNCIPMYADGQWYAGNLDIWQQFVQMLWEDRDAA